MTKFITPPRLHTLIKPALAASLLALIAMPLSAQADDRTHRKAEFKREKIVHHSAKTKRHSDRQHRRVDSKQHHRTERQHRRVDRKHHRAERQHRRADRRQHRAEHRSRQRDHRVRHRSNRHNQRSHRSYDRRQYSYDRNRSYQRATHRSNRHNGFRTNYKSSIGINFSFGNPGFSRHRWAQNPYSFYQAGHRNISYSRYQNATSCERVFLQASHYNHQERISVKQCYNPADGYYIIQGSERIEYCSYQSARGY